MLPFTSFEVGFLKSLNQKIKSYSDDSGGRKIALLSEYLLVDEQIEAIWIEISEHKLTLSNSSFDQSVTNPSLHIFCCNTPCEYQISNLPSQKIKQGILVISTHEPYQLSFTSPYEGRVLLISFSKNWYDENIGVNSKENAIRYNWVPIYSYFLTEINKLKEYDNYTGRIIKKSILSQFIFQILFDLTQINSNWSDSIRVNKIKKYLISNLNLPFPSLKFLAEIGYMSVSQLKSKFRALEGSSPQQFFIDKKMEAAIIYLQQDLSVKEIANLLGYTNSSNFINAFKSKYGKSPLQYHSNT